MQSSFIECKNKPSIDLIQIDGELTHAVIAKGKIIGTFCSEFFASQFVEGIKVKYIEDPKLEIREIAL